MSPKMKARIAKLERDLAQILTGPTSLNNAMHLASTAIGCNPEDVDGQEEKAKALALAMRRASDHFLGVNAVHVAYRVAVEADDAWSAELQRLFGKNAGDVRYTARGKGEAGSKLRELHDAKIKADEIHRAAWKASA